MKHLNRDYIPNQIMPQVATSAASALNATLATIGPKRRIFIGNGVCHPESGKTA